MPPKKKANTQKRTLDDPADVSISVAPAPAKKAKAPANKKGPNATASTQDDPPPSTSGPAPPPMTTVKARPKPVGKSKAPAPPPTDEATVPANAATPPVPPAKSSKRDKKPSEIAQKVQAQEVAKKQAQNEKARKKAKKEEAVVIEETPEETQAFVERMKAAHITPAASNVTASTTTKPRRQPSVDHRKAMGHLINSHRPSPPPSVVSGLSLTSSAVSSLAPSESISQRGDVGAGHDTRQTGKAKGRQTSQLTLQIPPSFETSRDVSPSAESIVTDYDDDEGPIATGFDLSNIFEGIPPPYVLEIKMPDPLPGHLHTVKRREDLKAIDYTTLKGADRQKEKRKQDGLQLSSLRKTDQTVASLAISCMDVLLSTCCAFPDDETCWILANMANVCACQKLGRNYALTRDSVYQNLLYKRISQSRGKFVKPECAQGIMGFFGLDVGWDADTLERNRNSIRELLHNAVFTSPSFEQREKLYEHLFFEQVLRQAYFVKPTSKGLIHPDLFKTITLPLMALAATATEKMLMTYSTGSYQKSGTFSAETFMPKYYGHLLTLAQMYRSNKEVLSSYLDRLMAKLRAPHATVLATQNPSIRSSVPAAFITQQYASRALPQASTSAATPSTTASSSTPGGSSQRQNTNTNANISLQSALVSIINSDGLTAEQKAKILRLMTENQHSAGPTTARTPKSKPAVPERSRQLGRAKMAADAWGGDEEDSDLPSDHDGEVDGVGEGEGEGEGAETGEAEEVDSEAEEDEEDEEDEKDAAEAEGDGVESDPEDGGHGGNTDGDEDGEGDDSDAIVIDNPPTTIRNFLPASGNFSDIDPNDLGSEDSDGEGTGGAVVADADATMASVASID